MFFKKIPSILLLVYLIEISTLLAASQLSTDHVEDLFNKVYISMKKTNQTLLQKLWGKLKLD